MKKPDNICAKHNISFEHYYNSPLGGEDVLKQWLTCSEETCLTNVSEI